MYGAVSTAHGSWRTPAAGPSGSESPSASPAGSSKPSRAGSVAGEGRERPGRRETTPADEPTGRPSQEADDEGDEAADAGYPDGEQDTGDEAGGDATASPPAEAGLVPSGASQRPVQHAARRPRGPPNPYCGYCRWAADWS